MCARYSCRPVVNNICSKEYLPGTYNQQAPWTVLRLFNTSAVCKDQSQGSHLARQDYPLYYFRVREYVKRVIMAEKFDFEHAWLAKFSNCLNEVAGEEIREIVMQGSYSLSADTEPLEVIHWSQVAMQRLETSVDDRSLKSIMTGCACQYPKSELQDLRRDYEATKDINLVHRKLQARFETFLRETLGLEEDLVVEVVEKGWGTAGIRNGDTIIATKIPKSGFLEEYLKEGDTEKKRQIYCHCPRVRDALTLSEKLPTSYCYCGAGFYKGIWEEILQEPVEVEVLESVLSGGEVCKVAIHLPEVCQ